MRKHTRKCQLYLYNHWSITDFRDVIQSLYVIDYSSTEVVKFIYSEKATKFCEILTYVVPVKSKVKILQISMAFSEYINFNASVLLSSITYKLCITSRKSVIDQWLYRYNWHFLVQQRTKREQNEFPMVLVFCYQNCFDLLWEKLF